ncbi:hypothetical protein QWY85_19620 [Neolewinella lacunae]|uniref:DUF4199 domain-containing protein n=1 Tax=Neolewinella lacunae TaxID=1517758 RepID=A0A923TA80_9BACT|nr:hypothetical protein [Neolewinella lacunae]MBC6996266.1 hypothetical protein [Neolewinella lacunae]MDN3636889.1 hypothetical protein [Neolewinella lacunae]
MKTIAIRYGLLFFACLLLIFGISHLAGFSERYDFRLLNSVAHIIILYFAINRLRVTQPETAQNYVSGVAQGMYAGGIGTLLFAVFITIFMLFNPGFLVSIQEATGFGEALTPIMAGFVVFLEGIAVSLIASYLITRFVDMRMEDKSRGADYASRGTEQ